VIDDMNIAGFSLGVKRVFHHILVSHVATR